MMRTVAMFAALAAAGCDRDVEPKPITAPTFELPAAEDLSDLAPTNAALEADLPRFTHANGWTGPRRHGEPELEGDGLFWQGLRLGSASCAAVPAILVPVESMQAARGGALVRYEPLDVVDGDGNTTNFAGNEISRDGAIAWAFGSQAASMRCPELAPRIAGIWASFITFVDAHGGGALYPGATGATITAAMRFTLDIVSHQLLGHARPSWEATTKAGYAHVLTVRSAVDGEQACYPVHTSALQVVIASRGGRPFSAYSMALFCPAAVRSGIPLAKWLCGKASAREWLSAAQEPWEYRHQRCDGWESYDLDAHEESHRLDWRVLYALAGGAW